MELSDISDPDPGIVRTTPTFREFTGSFFPVKKSHTSPSYTAPRDIAFAESITLPPPTARIKSILFFLHISIPSYTRDSLGFGTTPPKFTYHSLQGILLLCHISLVF